MNRVDIFLFRTRISILGGKWSVFDLFLILSIASAVTVVPLFFLIIYGVICATITQALAEITDMEIKS